MRAILRDSCFRRMMPMVSADAIVVVPGASTPAEVGTSLEVLPFGQPRFGVI